MRFIRYFFTLFAISTLAIVALLYAPNAAAQSFGVTTAQFFKRMGDAILPNNSAWTIGSSGSRISTLYANTVDALSMAIGGVVSGDLFVSGNGFIYGSGGLQTPKLTATSTGLALQVDGRSLLTGAVTTTVGILPATAGGANIGSTSFPYGSVYATGTSVIGGAMTVTNGSGAGADRVQIGYEQSPAQGFMSTAPLNIYAHSTGYVDAFTMTAGGNGADGACFAAKNLGATLGRQCQVSGTPSYYIMSPQGIAFQDGSVTPAAGIDMIINNNKVGIGISGVTPAATLEVQGSVSSTSNKITSATNPNRYVHLDPGNYNLIKFDSQDNYFPFTDGAFYFRASNIYVNGGTIKTESNDNLRLNFGTGVVSSTQVTLANGTAAAPSHTFSQDTDSGMYRLAANTPAMSAGSAHSLNFNDGWVSVGGVDFASMADGDGYYFGDQVRGLRYMSGGDFEFQNWHLNKFYFTKYTGSVRTRFAVFDSPTNRVAMSDAGTLLNYTPNTALEVLGSGVSSTQLNVNGTSTLRTLMLGGNTIVDNLSPLYINYTPTQAMADAYTPTISIRNTSSTLSSIIEFSRADGNGNIGGIEVGNESVPVDGEMGFSPANMMIMSSTSGTIMMTRNGSAITFLDPDDGSFRPMSGLGFGGGAMNIGGNASTTITDGNMQSASLDFSNSVAAGTQDLTVTVAGAADGDECQIGVPNALASRANETFTCFISAANMITVRRTCVNATGCGDPSAATVKAGFFHRQ